MKTLVEKLVDFGVQQDFKKLPREVAQESKRMLLDSVGVALAGTYQRRYKFQKEQKSI